MLAARLLNSDAELNNFRILDSISYVPGENIDIVFQILNPQLNIRYMLTNPSTVVTAVFEQKDGTELSKTASLVDSEDKSIYTISLDSTDTENVIGSNIRIDMDILGDGTDIKKAVLSNVLSKTFLGDC